MPELKLDGEIEVEVRDKNGKLLKYHKQKMHSWVGNFIKVIRACFGMGDLADNIENVTLVDGSTRGFPGMDSDTDARWQRTLKVTAGTGNDNFGLLFGLSDTPVTRDDYNLKEKITEGTGNNQMNYGTVTLETMQEIENGYLFRIIRSATNNSPSDITVKEIGLFVEHYPYSGPYYFMLARDVLASPVTVPVGSTITVRYIVRLTVGG